MFGSTVLIVVDDNDDDEEEGAGCTLFETESAFVWSGLTSASKTRREEQESHPDSIQVGTNLAQLRPQSYGFDVLVVHILPQDFRASCLSVNLDNRYTGYR